MQPSLYISGGKQQGTVIRVAQNSFSLGRSSSNQFQLLDREVSRRHFEVVNQPDGYWIRDLASNNGTFVNGTCVSFCQLKSGDRIRVGQTELLFTGPVLPVTPSNSIQVSLADDLQPTSSDSNHHPLNTVSGGSGTRSSSFDLADQTSWQFAAKVKNDIQFVYQAAITIGHTLDENELLQHVLSQIFEWVDADRACIVLAVHETNDLIVTCAKQRHSISDNRMRVSRSILQYVKEHNEGILTNDARDDDRWEDCGSAVKIGIREAICVPLKVHDKFLGAIYVDMAASPDGSCRRNSRFTEEHLKLMMAIGNHAAVAVQNSRYYSALINTERLAAIGQTIASLSHHIKNILQGINGGTYLLEQGLTADDRETTVRGWTMVKNYQDQISQLVLDMLSFSKDREPIREMQDLNNVVSEVVEILRASAVQNGVTIDWKPAPGVPRFEFDSFGIRQAVHNVMQNAMDACQKCNSPKIFVSIGLVPGQQDVVIVVQDNGKGIEPDELEKVFELFHSTKGNRGTGLGLAVARKIIQEHNGTVTVESRLGTGSKFVLRMPMGMAQSDAPTLLRPHHKQHDLTNETLS
jgi:signal transduction histidine kinase/pSer/pThr/pTyr-binding forkhead associated (FHA) protein